MYLIPLQRRAHNTQKACKLSSEPGSLICVEWGYAAVCLSAHHANKTMTQTAFCSTKACTMPVIKLICSDKRLADCYCSTRDRHSSIAVIRSRTFNGPKRFVAKTSLHLHGQQNLEGNLGGTVYMQTFSWRKSHHDPRSQAVRVNAIRSVPFVIHQDHEANSTRSKFACIGTTTI